MNKKIEKFINHTKKFICINLNFFEQKMRKTLEKEKTHSHKIYVQTHLIFRVVDHDLDAKEANKNCQGDTNLLLGATQMPRRLKKFVARTNLYDATKAKKYSFFFFNVKKNNYYDFFIKK